MFDEEKILSLDSEVREKVTQHDRTRGQPRTMAFSHGHTPQPVGAVQRSRTQSCPTVTLDQVSFDQNTTLPSSTLGCVRINFARNRRGLKRGLTDGHRGGISGRSTVSWDDTFPHSEQGPVRSCLVISSRALRMCSPTWLYEPLRMA